MASPLSGDDIRTVMRYYTDPSAVHVENVHVVDLLLRRPRPAYRAGLTASRSRWKRA